MGQTGIVRDPVHGDIKLEPLALAVVDSTEFQRLRYIRQNGLLHFVFPGAIHTRFAHSIGTYWLARRMGPQLFGPGFDGYLRTVFDLAALLHDVGHAAFSHSIEHVTLGDGRAFVDPGKLFRAARAGQLWRRLSASGRSDPPHELMGALLVTRIFKNSRVRAACGAVPASEYAQDVNALLEHDTPSPRLIRAVKAMARGLGSVTPSDTFVKSYVAALHSLISGTIDVDRMDYLQRDSFFAGVSCGRCEVDLLVRTVKLRVVPPVDLVRVAFEEKAVQPLTDLLWSRYQLFHQVLMHKTNVALNAVFPLALKAAVGDRLLRRPQVLEDYLSLTDDSVMAAVFKACIRGRARDKPYGKALVERRLPKLLDRLLDPTDDTRRRREAELRGRGRRVLAIEQSSTFLKEPQLPMVISRDGTLVMLERVAPLFGFRKLRGGKVERRIPPTSRYVFFFSQR